MGCLRIGTLRDFRNSEHKQGIADPMEGKKHVSHHIRKLTIQKGNDPTFLPNNDYKALSAFNIINTDHCNNISFKNVSLGRHIESKDLFIYCLSREMSARLLAEFEGSDSIVQIINPECYFRSVTMSLNCIYPVRFCGVHEVIYTKRRELFNGVDFGVNPELIKEQKFTRQSELRAIWEPLEAGDISPTVIGNCLVPQFCKLVY